MMKTLSTNLQSLVLATLERSIIMKIFSIVKRSVMNWYNNDPFNLSAAIAFYTIFSFPALLLIYLTIAAFFASREDLQLQINEYLENIVGEGNVGNIQAIIENSAPDYTNPLAAIIGIAVLLFAGLKLFLQLQKTLNFIWRVKPAENVKILDIIKQRFISLGVMVAMGFIILTSLVANTLVAYIGNWIKEYISEDLVAVIYAINFSISFLITSFLFAVLLKLLPDTKVKWKYAAIGGIVTAILFALGQYGLAYYFRTAEPQSAYGVAGSIILMMLWVSYSCVILLFGAELTKVVQENGEEKAIDQKSVII
jgi:membrane protein